MCVGGCGRGRLDEMVEVVCGRMCARVCGRIALMICK